ncbi:hypothetical protein DL96DRAFT_164336 [Flagelloscypha sp. PMI_526]|nr:hypothetical protein DL96DRAFT_164336 [Flagelloscypha sp. PMI_526]
MQTLGRLIEKLGHVVILPHQWLDTDLCLLAVEDGVLYLRGQHSATTIWGCIGRFGLHQSISKICIRERRSDQRLSVHDWTQAFRMLDSVEAVEIFDYSDEPQGYNWAQTDQSSQTILEALTPRKGGLSQTTGRHIFGLQSRKKASGAEIVVPCPRLDALEIHHDHLFRIVQLQSLVARRGQCGYKLEELELIHHEMTIPGYGAAGPSAFSRQDVATLEEFVTDISLSRQHVVEKLVKVQHSPPPIPHPPWDPQSPPPQPHYISPTVSAEVPHRS